MSAVGLGCVKTRRRGGPIEWTFRQTAISAVRILKRSQFRSIRERSFSALSRFRGFHTARVMGGGAEDAGSGPLILQDSPSLRTSPLGGPVPGADILTSLYSIT